MYRTLVSDQSVTVYGPLQIWNTDTIGTTSLPNGIILKSGRSSLISSSGKDSIDIYYSSNGFVITALSIYNRSTSFFVGLSANLNDSLESPTKLDSWVTLVQDSETNYFFLFDSGSHYSKMIITEKGGGAPGDPQAWVKVKLLYNNKTNDRRF
jgi:hypothetical protein